MNAMMSNQSHSDSITQSSNRRRLMSGFIKTFSWIVFSSFLFSGCFESQFDFKTTVGQDGTVLRQTHIDGRGASLFKLPKGDGWQARAWETKGGSALLPAAEHHIEARGQFKAGQIIPPDYEFDFSKPVSAWQEESRKKAEKAGIKPPYENHLFSRNNVRVNRLEGFFTITTLYEESFQNAGVINLLLIDLKDELAKQAVQSGQELKDPELEELARLRLESEILPEIRFRSEVRLPGKVVSTNGKLSPDGSVHWQFSLKDFQKGYSEYSLEAVSRTIKVPGMWVLVFFAGLLLLFVILAVTGMKKISPKKKPKKPSSQA